MSDIFVSSAADLNAALTIAAAGDVIVLRPGSYGDLVLSGVTYDPPLIFLAEQAGTVLLGSVTLESVTGIRLSGVTSAQGLALSNSVDVEISGSSFAGPVDIRNSDSVVVASNTIADAASGVTIVHSSDVKVADNSLTGLGGDFIKVAGASQFILIEDNSLRDAQLDGISHAEAIQVIAGPTDTPRDIIIRGNTIYDDPATGADGLGGIVLTRSPGTGYENVVIEQNLISVPDAAGIAVYSGDTAVTIRDNTLLPNANNGGGIHAEGADVTVIGNIANTHTGEAFDTVPDGANYFYATPTPTTDFPGTGAALSDFIPNPGSSAAASGMGAEDKLTQLFGTGVTIEPPILAPGPNTPTPEPNGNIPFELLGDHHIASDADVLEYAHSSALELDSATIALSFTADTVSGSLGLISKDASYFTGGGNHFTAFIRNGTLHVRFQDGSVGKTIKKSGIEAGQTYDLQMSFGDGKVIAILDGAVIGEAEFATSWESNSEYLQIGGNGWASKTGEAGFTHTFQGTISDVRILNGIVSYTEVQALSTGGGTPTPVPPGAVPAYAPDADSIDVLRLDGDHLIQSADDVIELAHDPSMALDAATLSLTFNANDVGGRHGLISKDARFFDGGGHHFTAYIDDGQLIVRFQDGNGSQIFTADGILAGQNYVLSVAFNGETVQASLNGTVFGEAAFNGSWLDNGEHLQIGANGWASETGESGSTQVFDGIISDVAITRGFGNDILHSTPDAEVFNFAEDFGQDRIIGFETGPNADRIDLSAIAGIADFTDLKNNFMSQVGPDVVIVDQDGNSITLVGTNLADLSESDFIF